ncbi:E3 ubiquitin-protein ligase RBBP6 [Madurella mycetomatis]|uniref:E3 ubiquitin-protein ligase RBBP6 n=1 Tax=Madurella mycetomatis TaxID=100816 RepID=A0A150ASH1_9PEZI|nr:E3 ubiquitin-protein ligase RBBP6 [Madurella mycetomatis]
MDHPDKIKQNLDILGLDNLKGLTMDQLLAAVANKFPPEVSKRRLLNVFVMWLHERLTGVDIPADAAFANEVSSWYNTLKMTANDDSAIAEAFHDWQCEQYIHDPASSGWLSIAELKLHSPMASPTAHSLNNLETARPEHQYGSMHPDRLKLSLEDPSAIEIDDDGPEVVGTPFHQWEDRAQLQTDGQDEPHGLSFLTGSNRLVLNDPVDSKLDRGGSPFASCVKSPEHESGSISKRRSLGYVCNRCRIPGHLLQNCPTDTDSAFDKKPQEDYKCRICKKTGDHLFTLCPNNRDPKSLTQQRRHNVEKSAKSGANHRHDYGSDFDNSHQSRLRNDRSHRLDEPPRGRRRSCSPLGHANGKRRRDMSPPGHEQLSHRPVSPPLRYSDSKRRMEEPYVEDTPVIHRLLPPQEHRNNRKHSGAMFPNKPASPKECHSRVDKRAKKKARRVTFCDDLVIEIKDTGEGRLSYYDVPATPLSALIPCSPGGKKMDIDVSGLSVQGKSDEPASKVDDFADALDEMIKQESAATGLLLLFDGTELRCSSPIFKLFKGAEEKIWVRRDKASRARPSDFFDLSTEGGHHARLGADHEMLARDAATKKQEQLLLTKSLTNRPSASDTVSLPMGRPAFLRS